MRLTQEVITTVVAYAAMLGGSGLLGYSMVTLLSWRQVRDWAATCGKLVEARLRKGMRYSKSAPLDLYIPVVAYTYRVNGRQYEGFRITVRDRRLASVDELEAQAVVDAIDREPVVYYKPSDPARAVLVNRIKRSHYDFLATCALAGLLLAGAGTLILSIR